MAKIRNKSGFSLLEMVIAMGLATGLLVFYMKMQGEQAKKTLTAKVNQEIETFYTDFKGTMDRPGFCSKSFETKSLADNSEVKIEEVKNPKGDVRYKVGSKYGNNALILKGITLKEFKADDKDGFNGIAVLKLDIEKIGRVYGSKETFKLMELSVTRDEGKKILGCGSIGSGGMNIQINVPAAASAGAGTTSSSTSTSTTTTSTTQQNDPSVQAQTQPQSTSTPSTTTPTTTAPAAAPAQEEMMKELEKNPELKKLQESLQQMQSARKEVEMDDEN